MPIGSITSQPSTDGIVAAYRPIIFKVTATATDASAAPPVVYCDIYFNGQFYKTIGKTQYIENNGTNTTWQFDIQDAAQEFLGKYIAANGAQSIIAAPPLVASVQCKFRSSGFDSEGFIQQEGTPPVQATGDTGATPGSGTASGVFDVVNATLQHEDSQDLATHLTSFKNRTWDDGTFPLTHRPDHYKVCVADSDYFPIVTNKTPTNLRIHYIPKGGTDYTTGDGTEICVPVNFSDPVLPNAEVGEAYDFTMPLSGSAPFSILGSVKPSWMSIDIDGSNLVFSGTPTGGDIGTHIQVSVSVQNCDGGSTANFVKFIDVTTCVAVSFADFDLPDATAGAPYSFSVPLSGTAPFAIDTITTKPGWMNIVISGSNLVFSGTPSTGDIDTGVAVQLTLTNCGGDDSGNIDETIDVNPSDNFILSAAYNYNITGVTGSGIPAITPTGTNGLKKGHQTGMSGSYDITITGTPALPTTKLDVYVNGGLMSTTSIPAAGTYSISITATEDEIVAIYINS